MKRREQPVDPYIRATRKLARTRPGRCDCPCHWYREVRHAVPCCQFAGMRYIASEDCYVPREET